MGQARTVAPIGPRTITRFRRVTVPASLRSRAGWVSGSEVALDVLDDDPSVIAITAVTDTATDGRSVRRRGQSRPRVVTQVGQVSIPDAVLTEAGLAVLSRVYFVGVDGRPDTVWLLPESRVRTAHQAHRRPRGKQIVTPSDDAMGAGAV